MKINCDIYRCANKAGTYLYLQADLTAEDLTDGLRTLLGELTQFLCLELNESSKLAQADTTSVLAALNDHGYFLQMPPGSQQLASTPRTDFVQ